MPLSDRTVKDFWWCNSAAVRDRLLAGVNWHCSAGSWSASVTLDVDLTLCHGYFCPLINWGKKIIIVKVYYLDPCHCKTPKWWTTNPSPFSSNTIFPSWPWGHCLLADLTQLFLPCLWPLMLAAVVHAQTFIYSLLPSAMVFEAPVSLLTPTTAPCEAPPSAACVDRAAFMHGTSSSAWLAFSWKKQCLDESMLFFGIFTVCNAKKTCGSEQMY